MLKSLYAALTPLAIVSTRVVEAGYSVIPRGYGPLFNTSGAFPKLQSMSLLRRTFFI